MLGISSCFDGWGWMAELMNSCRCIFKSAEIQLMQSLASQHLWPLYHWNTQISRNNFSVFAVSNSPGRKDHSTYADLPSGCSCWVMNRGYKRRLISPKLQIIKKLVFTTFESLINPAHKSILWIASNVIQKWRYFLCAVGKLIETIENRDIKLLT